VVERSFKVVIRPRGRGETRCDIASGQGKSTRKAAARTRKARGGGGGGGGGGGRGVRGAGRAGAKPGARNSATPTNGAGGTGGDTRDRILHAAFQLFHEQGYHATGISTILREAGVNAGSLYHYFPSKDALLIGVLEFALVLLRPAVMGPAEQRTDDPIERVFELLMQYREGMHALGCKMGCPMGNLALEVADDHERARELIHRNFENWASTVRSWLEAAGDRLPTGTDRARLARFVLTVMEGGIMQARAAGTLWPFDESVQELRAYFEALERVAKAERAGGPSRGSAGGVPGGRAGVSKGRARGGKGA
jgi:TetR/AcrR family transcriptional regulator, transcriptional repressor for nem operon